MYQINRLFSLSKKIKQWQAKHVTPQYMDLSLLLSVLLMDCLKMDGNHSDVQQHIYCSTLLSSTMYQMYFPYFPKKSNNVLQYKLNKHDLSHCHIQINMTFIPNNQS